ncbi:MAG: hypothetical protein JRC86_00490 [Deltaproteobacteria bacterium]|nr:hypothetical protein [Deltaproteobacteria bacterium]
MPTDEKLLTPEEITASRACRENTGSHMCDSGGSNGRSWQQGDIGDNSPVCSLELYGWDEETGESEVCDGYKGKPFNRGEIMPILHTGPFLDEVGEINRELQDDFEDFAGNREDPREPWEMALEAFMEESYPGWECASRGNTYNEESDLDQCFTWWVFVNPEEVSDWVHADDGEFVTILRMHTGADVRGGYGRPIFYTEHFSKGGDGYPLPLDHVSELYFGAIDSESDEMGEDFAERFNQDGRGSCGYSHYPIGEVMPFIRKCFPGTLHDGGVDVEVGYTCEGKYDVEPGDEYIVRVRLVADSPYS